MALESASLFSGLIVMTRIEDEGLPKVLCRWASRLGHLCNQSSTVYGSSMYSGRKWSAIVPSGWAVLYVLSVDGL